MLPGGSTDKPFSSGFLPDTGFHINSPGKWIPGAACFHASRVSQGAGIIAFKLVILAGGHKARPYRPTGAPIRSISPARGHGMRRAPHSLANRRCVVLNAHLHSEGSKQVTGAEPGPIVGTMKPCQPLYPGTPSGGSGTSLWLDMGTMEPYPPCLDPPGRNDHGDCFVSLRAPGSQSLVREDLCRHIFTVCCEPAQQGGL